MKLRRVIAGLWRAWWAYRAELKREKRLYRWAKRRIKRREKSLMPTQTRLSPGRPGVVVRVPTDLGVSSAKANAATATVGTGAVMTGAPIYGALTFLRSLWPDLLPWGADRDLEIASAAAIVGGALWTWWRTYRANAAKEHYAVVEAQAPALKGEPT